MNQNCIWLTKISRPNQTVLHLEKHRKRSHTIPFLVMEKGKRASKRICENFAFICQVCKN